MVPLFFSRLIDIHLDNYHSYNILDIIQLCSHYREFLINKNSKKKMRPKETNEALLILSQAFVFLFISRKCWRPQESTLSQPWRRPECSGDERLTRDDCQEKRCTHDGNRHAEEPHIIYPLSPPLVHFYPLPPRDLHLLVLAPRESLRSRTHRSRFDSLRGGPEKARRRECTRAGEQNFTTVL